MNQTEREDKILLARMEDLSRQCEQQYMITSSDFLDMRQISLVKSQFRFDKRLQFYGGFDDAERCIAVFVPEYIDGDIGKYFSENEEENPVECLRITVPKGSRKLSHRDYLGSVTGMGIRREKTGDILVREDGADMFVLKEISDYLLFNYEKAGRTSLKVSSVPAGNAYIPVQNFRTVTDTVASLRLDSVLASAFGMSRANAAEAIRRGIVFVNSSQEERPDFKVSDGDRLVIRGKGKARLLETGGRSRKDRIYIKVQKYL